MNPIVNLHHGKDIKIFAANANQKMARQIADHLELPLPLPFVQSLSVP